MIPETPEIGPPVEVHRAFRERAAERDHFVRVHPRSTFFHQSGWTRFVELVWRHEDAELWALRDGRIVGVLPLMLCSGLFGRRRLVSQPYAVYGGPLGEDATVERALVAEANRLAQRCKARYVELRCLQDPGLELSGTDLYWTFMRELPDDPSQVLARMPKKARAEARKARERYGLELSEGSWYLEDLCRLFLSNKHDLGSPGLPIEHFSGLLREFGSDVYVHLVRKGRTPLAAVMSFGFRDTLIAYYAGTANGADRDRSASNFMYLALQEWAVTKGFKVFDFCRSRANSGAFHFKCHQGFEPIQLHYRFLLLGSSSVPEFNPSNPRTAFLRQAWSRLPLWAARALSPPLARYLI